MTDAEQQRAEMLEAYRVREGIDFAHWHPPLHAAILDARLIGRHGQGRQFVMCMVDPDWFTDEQKAKVYAAFDAGVEARKRGTRCMCNQCITPDKITQNEHRRGAYRMRREQELKAQGYSAAEVEKRVLEEIDRGMWL